MFSSRYDVYLFHSIFVGLIFFASADRPLLYFFSLVALVGGVIYFDMSTELFLEPVIFVQQKDVQFLQARPRV